MAGLLSEMKRRNVFRVAIAYLVFSWLLLQVAGLLLPAFGAPEWVLRVIVLVLAMGFPGALVFSWVFELTPDGLRLEKHVSAEESITAHTARKLDVIVIVMLVITLPISFFGPDLLGGDSSPANSHDGPSVAVIPFVNMSGVAENEYFSDGLTETLLHMLAQVDRLKVAARTSSFAFKNREIDIREIASQLGVNHVLEGSVQRSGDRVRITAQLIDAADGSHLWSENYDRRLDDIFVIQDEIAKTVAERLLDELLPDESVVHPDTENTLAYDLYLRSKEENRKGNFAAFDRANAQLRQALVLDPDFTDARIELAINLYRQSTWGKAPAEFIHRAIEMLEDVERENNGHARAAAYRLMVEAYRDSVLLGMNPQEDFLKVMEAIVEQFPRDEVAVDNLIYLYINEDMPGAALREIARVLEFDPMNGRLYDLRGRAYELRMELEHDMQWLPHARTAYERAAELSPENASALARFAGLEAKYGNMQAALAIEMRAFKADPNDPELPVSVADDLYAIGEIAGADVFADMARAIDPAAPAVQKIPINRAFAVGDMESLYAASKRVIDQRVENRWGLHADACMGLGIAGIRLGRIEETAAILGSLRQMPEFRSSLVFAEVIRMYVLAEGDEQVFREEREALLERMADDFGGREKIPEGIQELLAPLTDDPADDQKMVDAIKSMGPGYRHYFQITMKRLTAFPVVQRLIDSHPELAGELARMVEARETMLEEARQFFINEGLVEEPL